MFQKIKNLLFYAGTEKSSYDKVKAEMAESNRRSLFLFSLIVMTAMFGMLISSLYVESLVNNRSTYCFTAFANLLLACFSSKSKDREIITHILMYIFIGILFLFGIFLGTFVNPTDMTVTFIIMLFAIPLLFVDRPIRMILFVCFGIIVYFFLAVRTQTPEMISLNATNVIPYGIISIIVSTYMMTVKAQRNVLMNENRFLSESDQLTGLLNRRSYEQHLQYLRAQKYNPLLKICALDINGLKTVNDTLGHQAGDELIAGAAECILSTFSRYGKCYRTGGDEYMVIIDAASPTESEFMQMLRDQTSCWKGKLVPGISVSVGMVSASPDRTIDEMVHEADMKMYQNKSEFYAQNHLQRRH